jgi:signal transduction histidine kinase
MTATPAASASLHILLIDDDPEDRALISRALRRELIDAVLTEIKDEAALRAALARPDFDAAVIDYLLHWSDGLSVMRTLREVRPDCAVVLFTSSGNEEVAVEAMKSGADDYVVKSARPQLRLPRALQHAVERRRAAAERQRLESLLALAEREKNQFLAMLSHELRNPLAPIQNAAELFHLTTDLAPPLREATERLRRQIRHLAHLLDNLLDAANMVQGLLKLDRVAIDLADVVQDAVDRVHPQIAAKRQTLTVRLPSESVPVEADRARLSQAIGNLLDNASRYSAESTSITLEARLEAHQAVITVRDWGEGIDGALIGRVFEVFVQGERTIARSGGGLGLGLALARSVVELHGGKVTAHSDGPGLGSTFVIRLPVAARVVPAAAATAFPTAATADPAALRVLIVDDNQDAAETLAKVLRFDGHLVSTAYGAETALTLLAQAVPDVAILDIGLPGIDGYELARRLRIGGRSRPLLIALTGYGDAKDRVLSHAAGFSHHLVKPVNADELRALLQGVLRHDPENLSSKPPEATAPS